jgi:hypothetical protein
MFVAFAQVDRPIHCSRFIVKYVGGGMQRQLVCFEAAAADFKHRQIRRYFDHQTIANLQDQRATRPPPIIAYEYVSLLLVVGGQMWSQLTVTIIDRVGVFQPLNT